MKVASLVSVALILCIAFPGPIQAKKKPKPKPKPNRFCIGKDGNQYAVGKGYEDNDGKACIHYKCVKRNKKFVMKKGKCVILTVDGEWSDWSRWSACTSTCGDATKTRKRTCSNPPPSDDGSPCPGMKEEIEDCSLPSCGSVENVNVTALELNVQSLNDTMQSLNDSVQNLQTTMQAVLELLTTMQSTANKQGTCLSDLSSSDCPSSAAGKVGVVDGIAANTDGITSNTDTCSSIQATATKLETCLGDVNSVNCPSSKDGKTSVSDAIMENKDALMTHHPAQTGGSTIQTTTTVSTIIPADWTIIQRRSQYGNAVNYFEKDFKDYEDGFGSVDTELWIGLKELAALTKDGEWELQVDLTDWDDKKYHAKYATFSVGPAPTYTLHVGGFDDGESTLGDSMDHHNGQAFSTRDKDQDAWSSNSCAATYRGGWWYRVCHIANLNGLNFAEQKAGKTGLVWYYGKSRGPSYKTWKASVMKIKRVKV